MVAVGGPKHLTSLCLYSPCVDSECVTTSRWNTKVYMDSLGRGPQQLNNVMCSPCVKSFVSCQEGYFLLPDVHNLPICPVEVVCRLE